MPRQRDRRHRIHELDARPESVQPANTNRRPREREQAWGSTMSDHAKEVGSAPTLWSTERPLSPKARRTLEARLGELLADAVFGEVLALIAKEVKTNWRLSLVMARWTVLAALARPRDLIRIHSAWRKGEIALAKVIVRRRVFDLFRREGRKPGHCSLAVTSDGLGTAPRLLAEDIQSDPLKSLQYHDGSEALRVAIECFALRGPTQQRQAWLLWRIIDETPYVALSKELGATKGALRVRVHKAIQALRRHVQECHCGHVH